VNKRKRGPEKMGKGEARNNEKESEEGHDNRQQSSQEQRETLADKRTIRLEKASISWVNVSLRFYLILSFHHPFGPDKCGKI